MKIVLHSDDIVLLEYWQSALAHQCEVIDAIEMLASVSDSIVIVSRSACNHCKDDVGALVRQGNRLLVLDRVPDFTVAKQLLRWGVKGYGNALMRAHFLVAAVETLKDDMVWLYPEFTTQLITQIESGSQEDSELHLQKLSEREREVALLLKEGDIYKTIAEKLGITSRTVKAHAQSIYVKLSVKDRLGLALLFK